MILGKSALTATPESASSALSSRQERSLAAIDGVASFLGKIGKPRKDRNGMHFIEKKTPNWKLRRQILCICWISLLRIVCKKLGNGASANLENPEIEEVREVWEFCWWSGKTSMYYQTCAIVAVILFQTRSVTSYFGLFGSDFYSLFCYF